MLPHLKDTFCTSHITLLTVYCQCSFSFPLDVVCPVKIEDSVIMEGGECGSLRVIFTIVADEIGLFCCSQMIIYPPRRVREGASGCPTLFF